MRRSETCIRRPVMTTLVMASLVAMGSAFHQPAVADEVRTVTVAVEYPNASADTMAISIAAPLEGRFSAIAGVASITSNNTEGNTQITLEFEGDGDIDSAIIEVRSAVSEVSLPRDLPAASVVTRGDRR